ncbi:hypothetical protein ACF1AB_39385 [Streptomyces sp. NPDC014846]|uniref:hypothetical protein n=1 Tax=Streptomyces sp. NPDC014846 TaxID=3364922 RepID=UPI003702ACFA
MTTIQPDAVLATGAVESFAIVWSSAATAEEVAPSLACSETDALAVVFRAAGLPDTAEMWISKHIATASECQGHDTEPDVARSAEPTLFDENGNYSPAPGVEYPFSISDIARATAARLGVGWQAESGYWGIDGSVAGPYAAKFGFTVDYEGDLCITFRRFNQDGLPESPAMPDGAKLYGEGVYLEGACAADGLDTLAERSAAAIRAVTGYDPAYFDFESSASRQHYIDTGRYLPKGEAEAV